MLCGCRTAPSGRKTHLVTLSAILWREHEWGRAVTGVMCMVCTCALGSWQAICHFVWQFRFVMWVAAHGSSVKHRFKTLVNTAWCCYRRKNKHFMIIGSSQSEKLLRRLFVNRLQKMTCWTNITTFVSVRLNTMDTGPEERPCHGEVSNTLCIPTWNTLNMCRSAGHGEQSNIHLNQKMAEGNILTRLKTEHEGIHIACCISWLF